MAENKTVNAVAIIEQAEIITNYAQSILDELTVLIAIAKGETENADRVRSIIDDPCGDCSGGQCIGCPKE